MSPSAASIFFFCIRRSGTVPTQVANVCRNDALYKKYCFLVELIIPTAGMSFQVNA